MTLFENQRSKRNSGRRGIGLALLAFVVLIGVLALGFLPTPYVIERPGPAVNVLGSSAGKPVISVTGADSYSTSGALDLLTVSIVGNRDQTPNWAEIFGAWLDPAQNVVPLDEIYPAGQTVEQSNAESTAMMEQSQQNAIYVALHNLNYKIPEHIYVSEVTKNMPSAGKIVAGDYVESINGTHPADIDAMRALVQAYDGKHPLTVVVLRSGVKKTFSITPKKNAEGRTVLGVLVGTKFDFPIKVNLQLSDIGGPSGGMIFALGIYDQLTQGELTGGANIAGTGTIDIDGTVGSIGGIQQKMYGAQRAGAKYFLAPADNCNEVNGHIPSGIQVFRVKTFSDALTAVKAIASKANLSTLATCASK